MKLCVANLYPAGRQSHNSPWLLWPDLFLAEGTAPRSAWSLAAWCWWILWTDPVRWRVSSLRHWRREKIQYQWEATPKISCKSIEVLGGKKKRWSWEIKSTNTISPRCSVFQFGQTSCRWTLKKPPMWNHPLLHLLTAEREDLVGRFSHRTLSPFLSKHFCFTELRIYKIILI